MPPHSTARHEPGMRSASHPPARETGWTMVPWAAGTEAAVPGEGMVDLGRLPVGLRIRGLVHLGRSSGQNAFSGCFVSSRTYRCSSDSARVVAGKALSVIENRPDTLA
ncbi:hypothetical protein Snoj_75940 [Streptomyces nojiriensis]|uniref:Uncharacterized protein n=1 Tax=Streptomyces nojiriensis TaxID=66374 RepID=A0ABQ3SZX5_9ACTN|nr:hypothetical protein Snoj_75940 [Streptomyces nojiriensis]